MKKLRFHIHSILFTWLLMSLGLFLSETANATDQNQQLLDMIRHDTTDIQDALNRKKMEVEENKESMQYKRKENEEKILHEKEIAFQKWKSSFNSLATEKDSVEFLTNGFQLFEQSYKDYNTKYCYIILRLMLPIAYKQNDKSNYIRIKFDLGQTSALSNDKADTIRQYQETVRWATNNKLSEFIFKGNIELGKQYLDEQDSLQAASCFDLAYPQADSVEISHYQFDCSYYLILLHPEKRTDSNFFQKGFKYYQECNQLPDNSKHLYTFFAFFYTDLLLKNHDLNSALTVLNFGLDRMNKGDMDYIFLMQKEGYIYSELQQYDKAYDCYRNALEGFRAFDELMNALRKLPGLDELAVLSVPIRLPILNSLLELAIKLNKDTKEIESYKSQINRYSSPKNN
jgi:hypothetical protein